MWERKLYSRSNSYRHLNIAICVALKRAVVEWLSVDDKKINCLSTFTTDTAGQLDVLWHDGHTLGVDCAQVGVLKQTDQVGLAGFLKSHHCRALEPQVCLEVLSNLADKALKRQLSDQQLSALLVTTDLTKCHGSRTVTVGLLDTPGGRCTLACCLGCKLLARCLASCRFTCSLLSTCHLYLSIYIVELRIVE